MIHLTAQMRVLVAIESVDGRKGIDSLVRVCQEKLSEDPITAVFSFFGAAEERRFGYSAMTARDTGLRQVYGHDAEARERGLTPDERLRLHQERSRPVMDRLHVWLETQLAERKTEPNSGLGQAISYLLRHWQPLTLFLREAGAPLDNNLVERALKRAVLHRKNALFYRTLNGAQVGDLFMSLIHTCQLCGVNSFDYLVELQRHARELAARPAEWMPWNYRQTLARTVNLPDPA
jgi:hypothetical protein